MFGLLRVFLLLPLLFYCVPSAFAADGMKPTVYVSILPQKFLVDRIGGGRFDVRVMVGPGESPATYEPRPQQMSGLRDALLYYRIGVPFETVWFDKIAAINPQLNILDARDGLRLREMEPAGGHHHDYDADHDHDDGHDHEGADPHIWMSPRLFGRMARGLALRLQELDPTNAAFYSENQQRLARELTQLQAYIQQRLEGLKQRRFMVFHPSWGYFADDYHLQQIPIESEGKQPGAKTLARLIDQAKREAIKVIFVQQQFDTAQARAVAQEIGGRVLPIDPLAEGYPQNMKRMADALAGVLRPE